MTFPFLNRQSNAVIRQKFHWWKFDIRVRFWCVHGTCLNKSWKWVSFPVDLLKYQKYHCDAWWYIVFISWVGELLFSFGSQSVRDGISIKMPHYHNGLASGRISNHKICHISIFEMTKKVFKPLTLIRIRSFQSEDVTHNRSTGWPTKMSLYFFRDNFYKNKETFKIFSP